jgi:hypothetical protein
MTDEEFAQNPLAIWIELSIGLDDRKELRRHKPMTLEEAAIRLSEESGADLTVAARNFATCSYI